MLKYLPIATKLQTTIQFRVRNRCRKKRKIHCPARLLEMKRTQAQAILNVEWKQNCGERLSIALEQAKVENIATATVRERVLSSLGRDFLIDLLHTCEKKWTRAPERLENDGVVPT